MNFDWNTDENATKEKIARLFDEDARSEIDAMEQADTDLLRKLTLKRLSELASLGYLKLAIGPDEQNKMLTLIAAQEALARLSGSLLLASESSCRLFGSLIAGFGSQGLGAEILGSITSGTGIGAVAVSEPGGDEPNGQRTTAVADGDSFRVTGEKSFVTNGPIADWIAVKGEIDGKPAFFVVEPGQKGLTVGPRIQTMGYNGMAVSGLSLQDVQVQRDRVLGPFDNEDPLITLRMIQDLTLTAASLGVSHRTLEAANTYARAYHRGKKPIYAHQEVRFRISDMFTLFEASKLVTYRAAWLFSIDHPEKGVLINCAKVFCAESAEQIASMALQIMAGQGYVVGNPIEKGYREAKYTGLSGTTTERSRMKIAEDLIRRYAI